MLPTYVKTAIAAFITSAFIMPAIRRYQTWKAERAYIPAARNWRGVWVPDLAVKRFERSLKWGLGLTFVFGEVILFRIMMA